MINLLKQARSLPPFRRERELQIKNMNKHPSFAAVFIDRDGTINEDVDYLNKVDELRLISGAGAAVKRINQAGLKAVVITNQSAIARGYLSEEGLLAIHEKLVRLLAVDGARLDGVYYCPHHPDDGCNCRKPASGMVLAAAKDLDVDLKKSYIIGDKISDIQLGYNLGLTSILVMTGYGRGQKELLSPRIRPDFIADDLYHAVEWILT